MRFDLSVLRKKGRDVKRPTVFRNVDVNFLDGKATAMEGQWVVADLCRARLELMGADGFVLSGFDRDETAQTPERAWYQEWYLRPPAGDE